MLTLDQEVILNVLHVADGTSDKTGTRSTVGVIALPFTVEAR